jgi:diaminopimelate epimerase
MIAFSKFEALGNDFMLVDARLTTFAPTPEQVQRLGHRQLGVGFDQLLILRRSEGAAVRIEIHNHDGSPAEQCGNGMRAVALYLHLEGELSPAARFETPAGPVEVVFTDAERISATLPPPRFDPPPASPLARGQRWEEHRQGLDLALNYVDLGNPHLVIELASPVTSELLDSIGAEFSHHPFLPSGANVSLAQVVDSERIRLSVYERGAGPTLACGSGACATAVSLMGQGRVGQTVCVDQPGGRLVIDWRGAGQGITMTGPSRLVFTGTLPADFCSASPG